MGFEIIEQQNSIGATKYKITPDVYDGCFESYYDTEHEARRAIQKHNEWVSFITRNITIE